MAETNDDKMKIDEIEVKVEDLNIQSESGEAPPQKISKRMEKKMAKGKFKKEKKEKKVWGAPKKKEEAKSVEAKVSYVNKTPKGEKKDMNEPMAAGYQPEAVESAWQDWWEKKGFFTCSKEEMAAKKDKPDERFIMIIPPPNVTGSLHLGHALTVAIQDTLTRWHRMMGHATLWVPGTDHAGIATQSVVEKRLAKEEGLSRHDLGREKFVQRVWDWKNQYEKRIHLQLRSIGCSVDWERSYFSMDDQVSLAVKHAFNKLWDDKMIYRASRLINWSCQLNTAISEIEVDYIDLEKITRMAVPGHDPKKTYEFGAITSFAYPVEDSDEKLIVATTRLETMLGDSAVAVHPEDPRYSHLHGKFCVHPINGRRIPIILDAELVDMEFGTGAVKITPAHDPNDYECGKRHGLEFYTILTDKGEINNNQTGEFAGMMRYDARWAIEKALDAKGLFYGKKPNKMRLGICSRSGDIIEPLIKPQWFIDCKSMAEDAMNVVANGDLKIIPSQHEKTWNRWLSNIRDWCVSRQLWWGHRIPAYYATLKSDVMYVDPNSEEGLKRWVAGLDEQDAREKAAKKLNVSVDDISEMKQDEDVLDTWVSAGLFPFAVFGWPENDEVDYFYPTDFLETGHDILFFWVARMVFLGRKLTGKLPFHTVYLHSLVRDKFGRKMSKSLGNVVDPLEIINGCALQKIFDKLEAGNLPVKEIAKAKKAQQEDFPSGIPECGADALRFGLLSYTQQTGDINLDINRLVGYRNFCNKLWNATRFAMTYLLPDEEYPTGFEVKPGMAEAVLSNPIVNPRDEYILGRLNTKIAECNRALKNFEFGSLTTAIYSFWLYDLCDVYLELIKPVMQQVSAENVAQKKTAQETLYICLETGLRLLHPVMPFVTEELWQRLPGLKSVESISIAKYPLCIDSWSSKSVESETNMALIKEVIHAGRSLRAEYGVLNNVRPRFFIECEDDKQKENIVSQIDDFSTLAKAGEAQVFNKVNESNIVPEGCAMHSVRPDLRIYVLLKGLVDFENEIKKLQKKKDKLTPLITVLETKMSKSDYLTNVPEKIREKEQTKMDGYTKEILALDKAIDDFKKLI